ncbi:hypothetical protein C5167_042017 [Papaver somniferum]|nr:hypothetical protein C5167_042017 [Papaver somniferum]
MQYLDQELHYQKLKMWSLRSQIGIGYEVVQPASGGCMLGAHAHQSIAFIYVPQEERIAEEIVSRVLFPSADNDGMELYTPNKENSVEIKEKMGGANILAIICMQEFIDDQVPGELRKFHLGMGLFWIIVDFN